MCRWIPTRQFQGIPGAEPTVIEERLGGEESLLGAASIAAWELDDAALVVHHANHDAGRVQLDLDGVAGDGDQVV